MCPPATICIIHSKAVVVDAIIIWDMSMKVGLRPEGLIMAIIPHLSHPYPTRFRRLSDTLSDRPPRLSDAYPTLYPTHGLSGPFIFTMI